MRERRVSILETAAQDLDDIADWLADAVSERKAADFIQRIRRRVDSLAYASERGTLRKQAPNLRVIGLMRYVDIAFVVDGDMVVVHRFFYRGRNFIQSSGWDADPDD